MLWWWPPQENAFAQATPLLTSLTGTYGERFLWTLVGTRSTQSGRTEPRNYLLKMPPKDVVIVSNKVPLSIGMDGATLFGDKFKLLRGDVDVGIDGKLWDRARFHGLTSRSNQVLTFTWERIC